MKKQVFLCAAFLLHVVDCSFQLQFQFHQYNNPSGLKYNDKCCDDIDLFGICYSACDTNFKRICLDPGGSSVDCSWSDYMLTPGKVGVNSIQFTDKIGDIDNPFTFTVTSQMGPFQLYVEVVDDDPFDSEEKIDEVKVKVPGNKGAVTSRMFTGTFGIVSLVLSYSLTCTQNYYGSDCSTYCVPSDNSMGHYNCNPFNGTKICLPGYQNPENDCTEVACALVCTGEGGNCIENGVCECSQGWSGVDCGKAQCAENCHPVGGYCNVPGECLCNDNWNGTNCDQFQCHPNCSTVGGTCVIAGECVCLADYTGEYCETDLNPCAHLSPCKNGGNCSNEGANQYSCACLFGFTGMDCEQEIDECNVSPCANGATCIDEIGDYECLCVLGWTGVNCEDDIDECFPQPCQHGGNCTDLVNGYYCSCPMEYEGHDCELMVNACIPDPCQNGGSCNNFITDYACDCLPGFTGKNCIVLPSSAAMHFTPSPSTMSSSSDAITTPVVAGILTAVLFALIAVVLGLVAVVLCTRKKKKFSLVSQNSLDSSQLQVTLKENEANFSTVSPSEETMLPLSTDPMLPVTADSNRLFESEAPNPLYGEGQNESGGNGTVHYESVDMSEAENPMYAGTLPKESDTQLATEEQQYATVDNPMYTDPLLQESTTTSQPIPDMDESFEREVDNPLYTMTDDHDDGFHNDGTSMEANPVYSDIKSHQYEYVSVPFQAPASTGESSNAQ